MQAPRSTFWNTDLSPFSLFVEDMGTPQRLQTLILQSVPLTAEVTEQLHLLCQPARRPSRSLLGIIVVELGVELREPEMTFEDDVLK